MDASGASSSSAADPINRSSHGVFINHRGPDTKKTFAISLYRRLFERGLKPFLDQEELKVGFNFPSQILGAIRSARVHVAIFSPTYAHSQWCLDELSLMLESGAPIIPIFFQVDPAELRRTNQKEKGVYAEALHKLQMKKTVDPETHEEKPRYDSATLQKWRKALSVVADISGFDLKGKFNGDEDLLLDEVVKRVAELMPAKTKLYVAKNPTGLNKKVKDFETTVLAQQHTGEVQVVGIVGLGGVGKTTLAKEFFNRKSSEYSNSYFLSDVRENARISLHSLQSKLLKGLFGVDRQIDNIHEGTEIVRQFLSSSKIFLILDDIDNVNQVHALLPEINVLDKDSLILITSRDEGVLVSSGVKESSMYRLTGLPYQHSEELFCSYAFCQPYPHPGFQDLVNEFLRACDGLPLSLIVFGALLSGYDDRSDWEAILRRLQLPNEIKNKLKISYDALGNEEQQIFLDIACFFIGKNKNTAITVWNRSRWEGTLGFKNLQLKCLAKVDGKDVIHMHDHLRDLGREIAETEFPRRLWRPTWNINDWLHQQSSVIMEARGIRMLPQGHSIEPLERSHQMLGNSVILKLCNTLSNKRYRFHGFDVMNFQLVETQGHLLDRILRVRSPNLIWLSWRDCPYKYLPSWITINNLRVLTVEGGVLETLWQRKSQAPLQLQELKIINASCLSSIPKSMGQLEHLERIVINSSSLAKLPNSFGKLRNLQSLELNGCKKLERLPDSFGSLTNLHSLDLRCCEKLERLPDSFGSVTNLHSLDLGSCQKLERLPDSFGSLTNLHTLDLNLCEKLERLPDSFGSLTNLHSLDLRLCQKLERLPDSFGSLTNLHSLTLYSCKKLERLPDSFGSLTNLHTLNLCLCKNLERLPDSLGSLTNLHSLDLHSCQKLERLPDSFGSLTNLHRLNLYSCKKLERLPDSFGSLTNLHYLGLVCCEKLERLPDSFGSLTNLHDLGLGSCQKLERLPDSFGSMTNLHSLDLGSCQKLERLPDSFGSLTNLHSLDLCGCRKLERLPDSFGSLTNLHSLALSGCGGRGKLERLPDSFGSLTNLHSLDPRLPDSFGSLTNLHSLDLGGCGKLERLPDSFGRLTNLDSLDLGGCGKLERLPDSFGSLTNLDSLDLGWCQKLERLPDSFGSMTNLDSLDLCLCRKLERLPDSFGSLTNLHSLALSLCEKLERLPDSFGSLTNLPSLNLCLCKNLERLPDSFGSLTNLHSLDLSLCKKLERLPDSFGSLTNLQNLDLSLCEKLERLPDSFGSLTNLHSLDLLWCEKLERLPDSFGSLTNLHNLGLRCCEKLERLPDSFGSLTNLHRLDLRGCTQLERLPNSFGSLTNLHSTSTSTARQPPQLGPELVQEIGEAARFLP